jgi:glycerol-3-phosphate acyltransferase PlsY
MKRVNLNEVGTGNFGATNVTMVFGRRFGIFVMLFDIAKGAFSYLLASLLFGAQLEIAGLLSGLFTILGHSFPFYLKFRGGKGLAAYGGVILAHSPRLFALALLLALLLMFIVNYSFIFPYSASVLVAVLWGVWSLEFASTLILSLMAVVIMLKHLGNIKRVIKSNEISVRDYISRHLLKKGTDTEEK